MCNFFSGIGDSSGRQYFGKGGEHSHTAIAEQHGLREDGASELDRVKWEYTPTKSARTLDDFEHFKLWLDQNNTPKWWNEGYKNDVIQQAQAEIRRQINSPNGMVIQSTIHDLPLLESLPAGLKSIWSVWNCQLLTSLPAGLTYIGHVHDLPLLTSLPAGLTYIGYVHDLPLLESLPAGLTSIGCVCNCPNIPQEQISAVRAKAKGGK